MPRFRSYRGSRRGGMRPVIQTYKQVQLHAPLSVVAGVKGYTLTVGKDNYAGPTATNNEVPTGAIIKNILIMGGFSNLISVVGFGCLTIQLTHSGQSQLDPLVVGGSPQRNQVFLTKYFMLGDDQNNNVNINFKIPKKFQRVREGDNWKLVVNCDILTGQSFYVIYKFYR